MCGRYNITTAPEAIRRLFGYPERPNFPPRYNVAPTQPIPIVRLVNGERHSALVRWGLIPSWVKDPKVFSLLINARGDTLREKPAFRNAMRYRRCLIPADGFYEWEAKSKRPYHVRLKGGGTFAFAGLWESWSGPNVEEMESAAIVTTNANNKLRPVHDRMPVMLEPEGYDLWLDCRKVDADTASALVAPIRDERIEAYEISPAVNRVANDSPDLIKPYAAPAEAPAEPEKAKAKRAKKDDGQASLF